MLLVVALLAAAGVVLTGFRRRPPADRSARRWLRSARGAWAARLRRARPRPRRGRSDVARVLVEVATRLRAGAQVSEAWSRSMPSPAPAWAGPVLAAVGSETAHPGPLAPAARGPTAAVQRRRAASAAGGADVAAAVSACRLAARTGAPLADVVDVVVGGIAEAAEADELRRTALAGPRATARLLAWLPAAGIGLGTALGADPIGVLLGGGLGGLCLVGGGALFLLGNRWVRALVLQAERAGR